MALSALLSSYSASNGPRSPILGGRRPRSRSANETVSLEDLEYLGCPEPEDPDLRTLNNSLDALTAVFPDIQVEVFREMLSTFDGESRLQVVTEALLKAKVKWVRGRWRVQGNEGQETTTGRPRLFEVQDDRTVMLEDRFRNERYRKAVKSALSEEFRGLSRSTINAVLAEENFSYSRARPTLLELSSKSWRYTVTNFLLRRKSAGVLGDAQHPLVIYKPVRGSKDGLMMPVVKQTGCVELDREVFQTYIAPVLSHERKQQEGQDWDYAVKLNDAEAEECEAMHDCECCFMPTTFEQLSACDDGCHFICFRCVRYAVKEAVFGQGWGRNIHHELGSLRCLAPMTDEDCTGCIPKDLVERALVEEKGGRDMWKKFHEKLAEEGLLKSRVQLVRCPFCSYGEVDEIILPPLTLTWHAPTNIKLDSLLFIRMLILLFGLVMIPFIVPVIIGFHFLTIAFPPAITLLNFFVDILHQSRLRIHRRRRGLKFVCLNPDCGRSSCLACAKEWRDIHVCYESELTALRASVERAMAEAIKRTCPRCNLSFVKASGCNKLTCVCGYQMCYVCRGEIGKESYRHFCEHFRPDPGKDCTECDKCDLYKNEDEDAVIRRAKAEAEREWQEKQGLQATGPWGTGLQQKNVAMYGSTDDRLGLTAYLEMPKWEDLLDGFVAAIT